MGDNTDRRSTALYVSATMADVKTRIDASVASATAAERIRDLERELAKWKLDWRAADQTVRTRNKEVMELEREMLKRNEEAIDQALYVLTLEREVERLKAEAATEDARVRDAAQKVYQLVEKDIADAERFRWLCENRMRLQETDGNNFYTHINISWNGHTNEHTADIRPLIDADRAKEGE